MKEASRMVRYIYARSDSGSIVNKVGKYLKNHIDGAYKIKFTPMTCEVTMTMYYQVEGDPNTFNDMDFEISITSYQNKVRVNLTEVTRMEKTIGQIILNENELKDLSLAKKKILTALKKAIAKEYQESNSF